MGGNSTVPASLCCGGTKVGEKTALVQFLQCLPLPDSADVDA